MAMPIPEHERHRLLSAWCDGSISEADAPRLDELIRSDPEFLKFYVAYMDQHALLAADMFPVRDLLAAGPRLRGLESDQNRSSGGRNGDSLHEDEARRALLVRSSRPAFPRRRPAGSWRPWAAAVVAGVAVVAVVVALAPAWSRRHREAPIASRPAAPILRSTVLDNVAMVIKLDEVRWETMDGPAPALGEVLKPRRLRMSSGLATLAFFGGATLTLEGPADVDLVGMERVFCRRGRLRARVGEGAGSFAVVSAEFAVVDRGTEFGLNVGPDGRSQLMVFEGAAEAALLDKEGTPRRTQLVLRSKEFDLNPRAGSITEAKPRPEGFIDAPSLAVPPLNLDPGYASAILRSRPRGYWRFESESGGMVPSEVPDSPPLRANGPVAVIRAPGGNGCALFKPGAPEQFLADDGPWELSRESGHAVEVWFLADGYRYSSLVGLYPPQSFNPADQATRILHTFFVELTGRGRDELHKPASVRFMHRWPVDIKLANNLFSETFYSPRRWHHMVAQKKGDRMDLYFDGAHERSMQIDPDYPTLPCRLIVGRRTAEASNPKDSRSFIGRLDELAIYDHTLSDEEVREHYQLGAEGARPN